VPGPRTAGAEPDGLQDSDVPVTTRQRIEPVDARTFTALLEQLQQGYVATVAATAGCTIEVVDRDVHGIDAYLIRPPREIGRDEEVLLGVQLKNTTTIRPDPSKETFSYKFKKRKYLDALTMKRKQIKAIVIVMASPPQQANWTTSTHDALRVEHCCYWANLEGYQARPGVDQPTVHIPTANIFDAQSLGAMMERLARGEEL
jgi:hypothetical protein